MAHTCCVVVDLVLEDGSERQPTDNTDNGPARQDDAVKGAVKCQWKDREHFWRGKGPTYKGRC